MNYTLRCVGVGQMQRHQVHLTLVFATLFLLCAFQVPAFATESSENEVFAKYARYGADVWAANPSARISGEGRACISCHTSLPYALVEPLLSGDYPAYIDLIVNVNARVLTWQDNTPWYSDAKAEKAAKLGGLPPDALKEVFDEDGSRGVESIFNAFIRAMHDAYAGKPADPVTQKAFENMWSEQLRSGDHAGSWNWIRANLIPWEVEDSDLWGASIACVAASQFPELAPEDNLKSLYVALRRGAANSATSLHVRAAILWCDTESGGAVIDRETAAGIVSDLLELQHKNGGWAIRELGPWGAWEGSSADCCAQREIRPDAYATGYTAFVLNRSRHLVPEDREMQLAKANDWIRERLADPYPAEPRNNRHESAEAEFPQFRNNIYTNAGHMWAFLAKTLYQEGVAPWDGR